MSLVNHMLRDLEERQDHSGQTPGVSPALSPRSEPASRGSKLSLAIGLGLFGCAAVLLCWHNNWWQPQDIAESVVVIAEQPKPAVEPVASQPIDTAPPVAVIEKPVAVAQAEPEPVEKPEPKPQPITQEKVAVAAQPLEAPEEPSKEEITATAEPPQTTVAASAATLNRQEVLQKAQQLAATGNLNAAAKKLESIEPGIEQHPGHYALLAGIYHKQGEHRQAAELYNQLVGVEQDNAIYWLGLAVALDALQDRNALGAFQATRRLNNNPDVTAYVERRINALKQSRHREGA